MRVSLSISILLCTFNIVNKTNYKQTVGIRNYNSPNNNLHSLEPKQTKTVELNIISDKIELYQSHHDIDFYPIGYFSDTGGYI